MFGPGRLIGSAHQPDEHVAINDVVIAGQILADLITTEAVAPPTDDATVLGVKL